MASYLLNAIPGALIGPSGARLEIRPVDPAVVGTLLGEGKIQSAVGHSDTAAVISTLLGTSCPSARISVPVMEAGDTHFLALYQGPRLPEGTTTLPEGSTLAFYVMKMLP